MPGPNGTAILDRLDRVRNALGLSRTAFLEKAGLSEGVLRMARKGIDKGKPASLLVQTLIEITDAHNVPAWLLFLDDAEAFDAYVEGLAESPGRPAGMSELSLRALHNLTAENKHQSALIEKSLAEARATRAELAALRQAMTDLARQMAEMTDRPSGAPERPKAVGE